MDDYVKSVKEGLEESVKFFENKNKQEREKWVLREFLSYLPVEFEDSHIKGSDAEPNDVFYKEFGFQVKEVQTEGRKRGKEYKDKLQSISEETRPDDLTEQYSPTHITLNESLSGVVSELARHREEKYSNNTGHMNVLVYLNLSDTTYTSGQVDLSVISDELDCWKSVSLVANNCAIVLRCNDHHNQLLLPLVGTLYMSKTNKRMKPTSR